ncbi:hypothetical protein Tco_0226343 [Tanacetum coccineum]
MLDRTDFEFGNNERSQDVIAGGNSRVVSSNKVLYVLVLNDLSLKKKKGNKADIRAPLSYFKEKPKEHLLTHQSLLLTPKTFRKTLPTLKDDVDNVPENDLALNMDHVFEAVECDAFDSDVDEGPTTQTMFMVNLTSEDPIYDEAEPSYDSNTPFEVQGHNTFEYHEVHEMQTDEQHNYVVDSDADLMSDSNIIPYDQYVEDNEDHVVQSNVSSVRNDALMSILDEIHE